MAIVGVGGLGCPASLALAPSVRHLTLIDPDVVEATNLHRQPWHHPADVGRPKVESARAKLARQFPSLRLEAVQERLTAVNVEAVFRAHELVLDCTDGVGTKFLLSDAAVLTRTPCIYAGVLRFDGLAMRIDPDGPCLRCLFESPPTDVPTCAQAGVLGPMAGLMGAVQAGLVREVPTPGLARLQVIDGKDATFRVVTVRRRPDCRACGAGARLTLVDVEETACPAP